MASGGLAGILVFGCGCWFSGFMHGRRNYAAAGVWMFTAVVILFTVKTVI